MTEMGTLKMHALMLEASPWEIQQISSHNESRLQNLHDPIHATRTPISCLHWTSSASFGGIWKTNFNFDQCYSFRSFIFLPDKSLNFFCSHIPENKLVMKYKWTDDIEFGDEEFGNDKVLSIQLHQVSCFPF